MSNEPSQCHDPRGRSFRNGRRRRAGTLWGLPVVTGLLGLVFLNAAPTGGDPDVAVRPMDWGLYQILWSRRYGEELTRELTKFASKPQYVMFYRDLGRPFPKAPIDAIAKQGATTVVSLELWSWHGGRQGSYLHAIETGEYDDFFRQWAKDAKADGRPVLLRFGFEFNGNWFTWSGDPKSYVAAWRRVHGIFAGVGANNVQWVWAPNIVSCPNTPENDMHRYYPGDAYVHWVALDGYNFGDHHDKWHRWQSCEAIYGPTLKEFSTRYPNKPLIITEFGSAPGKPGQRANWIREAFRFLQGFPQVKGAIWFNYDKRREGEPDWRIDTTGESLRAFNETFAAPRS
ncbi:MAG: hypothetical protein IID43_01120 [Planctomycetes bacterium]|nr:hypothetical protein [Planctomycetota bacterium]